MPGWYLEHGTNLDMVSCAAMVIIKKLALIIYANRQHGRWRAKMQSRIKTKQNHSSRAVHNRAESITAETTYRAKSSHWHCILEDAKPEGNHGLHQRKDNRLENKCTTTAALKSTRTKRRTTKNRMSDIQREVSASSLSWDVQKYFWGVR